MEDTLKKILLFSSIPYIIGMLLTQIHYSQYGIFELKLFDKIYIYDGLMMLISLLPGTLFCCCNHYSYVLHNSFHNLSKRTIICFLLVCILPIYWLVCYNPLGNLLVFDSYLYPDWYFYTNILWANGLAVAIFIIFQKFRSNIRSIIKPMAAFVIIVFLFTYTFFYARTIYPALPGEFGGGCPREAKLILASDTKEVSVLILLEVNEGLYFLNINEPISPECDLVCFNKRQKCLCENRVEYVNKDKIIKMMIINRKNNSQSKRYLIERKHFGF